MPTTLRAGLIILAVAAVSAGALAALGQAPPRKPLAKQEIVELLKNGVSPLRVEELARQYGISFALTPEAEDDLLAAGATEPLVNALRGLSRKTEAPPAGSAQAGAPQDDFFEQFFGPQPRGRDARQITRGALRGVAVRAPEPRARRRLGLDPEGGGVFVTFLEAECPAAKAGLQRGDMIESVNRRPVKFDRDFMELALSSKGEILLRVNRRGNAFFMLVQPSQ
jgi:hypothetical protein